MLISLHFFQLEIMAVHVHVYVSIITVYYGSFTFCNLVNHHLSGHQQIAEILQPLCSLQNIIAGNEVIDYNYYQLVMT